ncbi:hypothetical protein WJX73_004548 [Symbiochloris irregularis]|uniref:Alfin N-terminal domain-containing protein n=1 Tax=Symbiochloris irregularis TaxID=706552 RepID=A0AAW1NNU0_9CHLO
MSRGIPSSPSDIIFDWEQRRHGLLLALTDDEEKFYRQCDPERENLCLYGESNGTWSVDLPVEEVPPELPEPCLGINFARDGMARKDWLRLVAAHSDAWLYSVCFFYGAKLRAPDRAQLFHAMNQHSTLFEIITERYNKKGMPPQRARERRETVMGMGKAQAADAPLATGRLLTYADVGAGLKGRQAELFWPDDKLWYLVEIIGINMKTRSAKITYTSGEEEELKVDEIIREGHMSLITQ